MNIKRPSPSAPISLPRDARYYRFGLCGLTSGGKTCLLAALAMPRIAHPEGLTATLLPLAGDAAGHLVDGWRWVDQAREALRNGKVPPPNPNTGRSTLRYKFTDGRAHELFVELVDYSGELLDSRQSQSDLAGQLRRYLSEVDGFLFVAEHPKPGENAGELAGYLLHLNEALALQRENARKQGNATSGPIALLLNKWDRHGGIVLNGRAHAEESRAVEAFLKTEPPPPHAGLLAELSAASGGVCRAFPVSAFGKAIREPGENSGEFVERPVQVVPELLSFGLEEPFLWLVTQRDQRDVEELAAVSRKRGVWWNTWSTFKCWRNVGRVATRMSSASPEVPRLRSVRKRLREGFAAQFVLIVLMCLFVELSFDAIGLRRIRAAMANPADRDGWTKAEAWFTSYLESGPARHVLHRRFFLSNAAAAAELQSERSRRDEQSWVAVKSSTDDATRAALARDYRANFPQGAHRADADKLIADIENSILRDQLRAQLDVLSSRLAGITEEVKQAKKNTTPDFKSASEKLAALMRDTQNVAGLEVADKTLAEFRQRIVAEAGALGAGIAGGVAIGEARAKYYEHIKRSEWDEAGRYLAGLSPKDFPDLRDHFSTHVVLQIETRARSITGNGAAWREGLTFVEKFQSVQMRSLLPKEGAARFTALKNEIKTAGDRWLFARCTGVGSADPFSEYLEAAPLQVMRQVAEDWRHFLKLRSEPHTFRVGVQRIDWGVGADGADNVTGAGESRISIAAGAGAPRDTKFWTNRKSPWVPDPLNHAADIKEAISGTSINVDLKVWDVDSPDDDDYFGGVKGAWLLEELDGRKFDLAGSEHGANSATFWVQVLDGAEWKNFKKPPLPPWNPAH